GTEEGRRRRAGEAHRLAGGGVGEAEFGGVEAEAMDWVTGGAVPTVAGEGMAALREVDADLVLAAGLQADLDQWGLVGGGERAVVGDRQAGGVGLIGWFIIGGALARRPGRSAAVRRGVDARDAPGVVLLQEGLDRPGGVRLADGALGQSEVESVHSLG